MTQHIIDTDELEPCPFCGSHNISTGEVAGNHLDGTYFVQTACMNCGALSPKAKTETESVELWNRRKANSPQADGMVSKPQKEGIYVWRNASAVSLVYVSKRPSGVEVGGTLNAQVIDSSKFYDGCAIDKWLGGHWIEVSENPMLSAYKPQADDVPPDVYDIVVDTGDGIYHTAEVVHFQQTGSKRMIQVSLGDQKADDVRKDAEPSDDKLKAMRDFAMSVQLSHDYDWIDYMRDMYFIAIDKARE